MAKIATLRKDKSSAARLQGSSSFVSQSNVSALPHVLGNQAILRLLKKPLSQTRKNAVQGIRGVGKKIPHFEKIQAAFGKHDISDIQTYTGAEAKKANKLLHAKAYAMGKKIAFADANPDLFTTVHEVAHTAQQNKGVYLKNGISEANDPYEQHADRVAHAVTAGKNVEHLLNAYPHQSHAQSVVSECAPIQRTLNIGTDMVEEYKDATKIKGFSTLNKKVQALLQTWVTDGTSHDFDNENEAIVAAKQQVKEENTSKTVGGQKLIGIPLTGYTFEGIPKAKLPAQDFSGNRTQQQLIQMSSILFHHLKEEGQDPVEVQTAFIPSYNTMMIATNSEESAKFLLENHAQTSSDFTDYLSKDRKAGQKKIPASKAHADRKKAKFHQRVLKHAKKGSGFHAKAPNADLTKFFRHIRVNNVVPTHMPLPKDIARNQLYISTKKSNIPGASSKKHAERDFIPVPKALSEKEGADVPIEVAGLKIPCVTCGYALDQAGLLKCEHVSQVFLNQVDHFETNPASKETTEFMTGLKTFAQKKKVHSLSNKFGYLSDSDYEFEDDDEEGTVKADKSKKRKADKKDVPKDPKSKKIKKKKKE